MNKEESKLVRESELSIILKSFIVPSYIEENVGIKSFRDEWWDLRNISTSVNGEMGRVINTN